MAKNLNMQFSGKIGPLVGCLRHGKYHYRSLPGKVQQTDATKASSAIFALASKAGKIMRHNLEHSIPNPKDPNMQRQLLARIKYWLRTNNGLPPQSTNDIPFVNHFNFNPARPLEEALRIQLSFIQTGPGLTQLQIPAFVPVQAIKAPARTTQLELCISAVSMRLGNYNSFGNESLTITVPYNDTPQPAQQIPIALQTDQGNILIAALQIRYITGEGPHKKYLAAAKSPAAIVGAVYM